MKKRRSLKKKPEPAPQPAPAKEEPAQQPASDGIRPEFKEAVDAYVKFYDEYVDFMKRYMQNPGDMGLLLEMANWTTKIADMDDKLDGFESGSDGWSAAETKYWTESYLHITQSLLAIAQ